MWATITKQQRSRSRPQQAEGDVLVHLQLFRERLSEKGHATIPKGIVGGFEFSVLQRNLKELARNAMEMCFVC